MLSSDFFLYSGTCYKRLYVVDGYVTPNPKFHIDLLLFHFAQGLKKNLISPYNQENYSCSVLKVTPETKFVH